MRQNQAPVPPDDVAAAKKMFYGGFALLPFLWLINFTYYRKQLANPNASDEFKFHVKGSLIGFLVFMAGWAVWLAFFYSNRKGWGDSLLLFQPDENVL